MNLDPKPSLEEVTEYNLQVNLPNTTQPKWKVLLISLFAFLSSSQNGSFFKKYTFGCEKPIGDGSFSICMKCVDNNTQKEYAVKILRSNQNVDAEIEALNLCKGHPNIVNIEEVIKDDMFIYIVTEWLAGKELFTYAQEQQSLTESEVRGIFKEIIHAVSHMHSHKIAHRDLKLENIKFTTDNTSKSNIKILDFGFACKMNHDDANGMTGACYTLDYAAPEILANKKYTESCDLWSLGVILFALLTGEMPFRRQSDCDHATVNSCEKITNRIKRGKFNCTSQRWTVLSEHAKHLIRRLLVTAPDKRIKPAVSIISVKFYISYLLLLLLTFMSIAICRWIVVTHFDEFKMYFIYRKYSFTSGLARRQWIHQFW